MDYKWHSVFRNSDNKVSGMEIAFLSWMMVVCVSYLGMVIYNRNMPEMPSSVVHFTLALGATKVTHKVAEGKWDKIFEKVVDFFKKKK